MSVQTKHNNRIEQNTGNADVQNRIFGWFVLPYMYIWHMYIDISTYLHVDRDIYTHCILVITVV